MFYPLKRFHKLRLVKIIKWLQSYEVVEDFAILVLTYVPSTISFQIGNLDMSGWLGVIVETNRKSVLTCR